jgi:hypothetical protein
MKNQMKAVMDHVVCSSFGVVALAAEEVVAIAIARCRWHCRMNNACEGHCKRIGKVYNKSFCGSKLSKRVGHGFGVTCKEVLHWCVGCLRSERASERGRVSERGHRYVGAVVVKSLRCCHLKVWTRL